MLDTTPVLDHAFVLKDIEPPNIVIATDGSRHELRGFSMNSAFMELTNDERREFLTECHGNVHFCADAGMPSGFLAESRIRAWCGNTWFPRPLPRKVSAYTVEDLGFSLSFIFDRGDSP